MQAPPKGPNQPYDPMFWDEFMVGDYGGYTAAEGGRGKGGPRGAPPGRGMGGPMGGMRGGRYVIADIRKIRHKPTITIVNSLKNHLL